MSEYVKDAFPDFTFKNKFKIFFLFITQMEKRKRLFKGVQAKAATSCSNACMTHIVWASDKLKNSLGVALLPHRGWGSRLRGVGAGAGRGCFGQ
ncbi:hypothetical protein [Sediminibacillus sp. JSM 1682029]|uniref:hypothetical protein n=1 Tax=Sediminibacillus sp. JSM 1682029 TaxID=3229857 RepID=UPI00352477C8